VRQRVERSRVLEDCRAGKGGPGAAKRCKKARSILLRKSALARKTALRGHSDSFISERVKTKYRAVQDAITPALVQRYFGPSVELDGSLSDEDTQGEDPGANAWNSLLELSNPEVVQALADLGDRELERLFKHELRDQLREYLQTDVVAFAPLLADALLKDPKNVALDFVAWVLLEPAVKKLSKNTKYLQTLEKLLSVTKNPQYQRALERAGKH
jgi:hypothetical protein